MKKHHEKELKRASKKLEDQGLKVIQFWKEGYDGVIQFYGNKTDLFRAYDILKIAEHRVTDLRRVWSKETINDEGDDINGATIGETWTQPVNHILITLAY